MATKTEIYELRKKEENDFYNVEDFNNNMDTLEKALTEFDDTGTAEGVTSFPEMLTKLVTGNKLAITLKNLKAGLQFVLHAGSIVNNCVTDNANLPVSAAMAKSLQDQINQANSNFLQAAICVVAAQDNTMTFTLKRPTGTDIRFTALVFLSNQSFNFIGAYAIGINRKTEVIAKIVGDTAATIKRIDDYTVTITFETYAIWSNGLAIIPKELL